MVEECPEVGIILDTEVVESLIDSLNLVRLASNHVASQSSRVISQLVYKASCPAYAAGRLKDPFVRQKPKCPVL